jgi:hypothetical protein
MNRLPTIAAVLMLAGCAQTVPASEIALTAAEATALQYVTLPACAPGATSQPGGALCSQATVVAQIKAADNTAFTAVKAAESGTGMQAAASAAVAALSSLVPAIAQ